MTWEQLGLALFSFAIVAEQAHVASPIVLAWTHPGLRKIALSRPVAYVLIPAVAAVAALASPFDLKSFHDLPTLIESFVACPIWWVYWTWNIYHFGAQHYGVGRLLGLRVPKWLCVGGTAAIMVGGPLLIHAGWWRWFALVAIDFNHWLVDIGLSSRVSRHCWVFIAGIAAFGCIGLLWKVPRADHIATLFVPWIIKARWGLGIVHFLYSGGFPGLRMGNWRLSDPRVRDAIGRELGIA